MEVLRSMMDRSECGNYKRVFLVSQCTGEMLLKVVVNGLSDHSEAVGILSPIRAMRFLPLLCNYRHYLWRAQASGTWTGEANSVAHTLHRPAEDV